MLHIWALTTTVCSILGNIDVVEIKKLVLLPFSGGRLSSNQFLMFGQLNFSQFISILSILTGHKYNSIISITRDTATICYIY